MKLLLISLIVFSSLAFAKKDRPLVAGYQMQFRREWVLNPGIRGDFFNNQALTESWENPRPICGLVRKNDEADQTKIVVPEGAILEVTKKTQWCKSFEGNFEYYCGEAKTTGFVGDKYQRINLVIDCQHGIFTGTFEEGKKARAAVRHLENVLLPFVTP